MFQCVTSFYIITLQCQSKLTVTLTFINEGPRHGHAHTVVGERVVLQKCINGVAEMEAVVFRGPVHVCYYGGGAKLLELSLHWRQKQQQQLRQHPRLQLVSSNNLRTFWTLHSDLS